MTIAIPTGVFDILPQDSKEQWRESHLWNYLEAIFRAWALSYSCHEIRTPLFERTELFCRSVGDATDIVSKEMYVFEDRGGRKMALRPEGTASVMRAYIEKQLHAQSDINRFFYIGPMFRYERPQSGRYRQHHQFGVEIIGNPHPEQDAEMIEMIFSLYQRLGLKNLKVYVNSLGDKEARDKFKTQFQEFLRPHMQKLSKESQVRFEINPLRILDSKDEQDQELVRQAPSVLDFLSDVSRAHFEKVLAILSHLKIPHEVNSRLVRGLDYYNNTVFEITSGHLGAQNSVAGGGRYDGLLKNLGGPDLPSLGFATGIERVIQALIHQGYQLPERPKPSLYIIPMGDGPQLAAFDLARRLRSDGLICFLDLSGKKVKSCMQQADKSRAEFVLVLGENELRDEKLELKEMKTGEKILLSLEAVPAFFAMRQLSSRMQGDALAMEEASRLLNSVSK
jgi:histidyl-tRNA synthetase